MMADIRIRRKMTAAVGGTAAALVLLVTVLVGSGPRAALAQTEEPAGVQESAPAEAAPAEAAPAEAAPREGTWVDFFFGTGIDPESRSVTGAGSTFPADGERVYCLTRVHGLRPPTTVTHTWYHEGTTMARVDLNIGSENWRTWSSKSYLPAWTGQWEVKVLDADGMVLGSAGFEVR